MFTFASHRGAICFLAVAVLMAGATSTSGADPFEAGATKQSPSPADYDAHLAAQLKSPTNVDFTDAGLGEVFDYFQAQHQIGIQMDRRALENAGVGSDTLVSVVVKGVSLRYALERVLQPLEADFLVRDNGTLLITTREEANRFLETVVYPVGDLIEPVKGNAATGLEELSKLLQTTIDVDNWAVNGGKGAVAPVTSRGALVITQNQRTHAKVRNLLDSLRQLPKAEKVAEARSPRKGDKAPQLASSVEVKIYDLDRSVEGDKKDVAQAGPFSPRPKSLENEAQLLAQRLPQLIGVEKWNMSDPDLTAIAIGSKLIVRQSPEVQRDVATIVEAFGR